MRDPDDPLELLQHLTRTREKIHAELIEACANELDLALQLLDASDQVSDPERKEHFVQLAQRVYEGIVSTLPNLKLTEGQWTFMKDRLSVLRAGLER